jgi:uncharacterized protein
MEPLVCVRNLRTGVVLGRRVVEARSFGSRLRGLLGRASLEPGEGLWIEPCAAVHMFFMRFAIDAIFVDRRRTVTRVVAGLRPWRIALGGHAAFAVLELPVGVIAQSHTQAGDVLAVDRGT